MPGVVVDGGLGFACLLSDGRDLSVLAESY
jgi:hypothetical protein